MHYFNDIFPQDDSKSHKEQKEDHYESENSVQETICEEPNEDNLSVGIDAHEGSPPSPIKVIITIYFLKIYDNYNKS